MEDQLCPPLGDTRRHSPPLQHSSHWGALDKELLLTCLASPGPAAPPASRTPCFLSLPKGKKAQCPHSQGEQCCSRTCFRLHLQSKGIVSYHSALLGSCDSWLQSGQPEWALLYLGTICPEQLGTTRAFPNNLFWHYLVLHRTAVTGHWLSSKSIPCWQGLVVLLMAPWSWHIMAFNKTYRLCAWCSSQTKVLHGWNHIPASSCGSRVRRSAGISAADLTPAQ